MKIFIITHKVFDKPLLEDIYIPFQVGAVYKPEIGYLRDDTGDNISFKNNSYCELTGLYWIWKNVDDDIIGLCHYRRYFVTLYGKIMNILWHKSSGFYNKKNISKKLQKCDIIVHNYTFFRTSVKQQYTQGHYLSDLIELEKIIYNYYYEYYSAFKHVMNGHKVRLLNMFIIKKEYLDKYCEWLFTILEILEKKIDICKYDSYQKRVFGFLAERLLDVWIYKNKLKVKNGYTINSERIDWKFWQ